MSYQVKDISQITGIDRETLRFYENKGLIQPKRKDSGYRIYNDEDILKIDFIIKSKKVGFTLSEIKELIYFKKNKKVTCRDGKEIAENKLIEINQKIKSLREMKKTLIRFSQKCDELGPESNCCLNFYCCK